MIKFELLYLFWGLVTLWLLLQFILLSWLDRHVSRWFWWPFGIAFILQDVLYNVVVGTLMFLELPREWLFTTRLKKMGDDRRVDRFRETLNYFDPEHV